MQLNKQRSVRLAPRRRLAGLGPATVVLLAVLLAGCEPVVEIVQPATPTPPAAAPVAQDPHDVAVVGIDFDPPLEQARLFPGDGMSLLIAVENRGLSPEEDVKVTARVFDDAANAKQRDLREETITVRSLAPGEVVTVRFSQVPDLPLRESYGLEVVVGEVAGEVELRNNRRTYRISLHPRD